MMIMKFANYFIGYRTPEVITGIGSILELPKTLIFVLNRFEFDYNSMTKTKLNDYYEFPIDLDMQKYTTDFLNNTGNKADNKEFLYKLKSVVIHSGNSEGGHYYSFIRDLRKSVVKLYSELQNWQETEMSLPSAIISSISCRSMQARASSTRSRLQ